MRAVAEVLVPAAVEPAVMAELMGGLPPRGFSGEVSTALPGVRPDEFVRVVATGGVARDLVSDAATVTVEYFATLEGRAERGAALALGLLQAAGRRGRLGGEVCYGVTPFGLPVNLPHPGLPDWFRFQFSVSVELRRSVA